MLSSGRYELEVANERVAARAHDALIDPACARQGIVASANLIPDDKRRKE
jgi:hypothetical protein